MRGAADPRERLLNAARRDQRAAAGDGAVILAARIDVEDVERRGGRIVVVVLNRDAIGRCQLRAVEQDEVDLAADLDAVGDGNVRVGHNVPAAVGPRGGAGCDLGVVVDGAGARRDGRAGRAVGGEGDRRHGPVHGHVPGAGILAICSRRDGRCCRRRIAAVDPEGVVDGEAAVVAAVAGVAGDAAAPDAHGAIFADRGDLAAVDFDVGAFASVV